MAKYKYTVPWRDGSNSLPLCLQTDRNKGRKLLSLFNRGSVQRYKPLLRNNVCFISWGHFHSIFIPRQQQRLSKINHAQERMVWVVYIWHVWEVRRKVQCLFLVLYESNRFLYTPIVRFSHPFSHVYVCHARLLGRGTRVKKIWDLSGYPIRRSRAHQKGLVGHALLTAPQTTIIFFYHTVLLKRMQSVAMALQSDLFGLL